MVAPTTSYSASTSNAAATDESTPPDIAMRTRSLTPRLPSAECGVRSAEFQGKVARRTTLTLILRIPNSALRTCRRSSVQKRAQCPHLLDNLRQGSNERIDVLPH